MAKSGKKDPERIRDVLGSVLEKASGGREHRPEALAVVAVWPELSGPKLARVSRAVSLEGGRLIVEVTAPAWKQELLFIRKNLIQEINRRMGANLVAEMIINVRDFVHD